ERRARALLRARGQLDPERAAATRRGLDPGAPMVRLDDPLDDREAHPRPGDDLPVDRLLLPGDAAEELEDPFVVGGRDADAVVADGEADAAVRALRGGGDSPARRGHVFDGVPDQVREDEPELARLPPDRRQPAGVDLNALRL